MFDMTDKHINACINKLESTYGRGYNYRQEWIKIFKTELAEREYERNKIAIDIQPNSKCEASVTIGLSRMPNHCGECPLYESTATFDEDAFFGDGIVRHCPFGASIWGCRVKRPDDCPLVLMKG